MYIAFDIGGTKTRIGLSRNGVDVEHIEVRPTAKEFSEGIKFFEQYAETFNEKVEAVVGGIAGPLNSDKTRTIGGRNIQGWVGQPVSDELQRIFSAPVYLENDALAAGLGEVNRGSGKGYKIVGYITVSTGLGGARFVNGKLDENHFGFEPGHQIIVLNDKKISLEEYISGTAIAARHGKHPHELNDQEVWNEEADRLAVGLNNIASLWSPELIVLGGGVVLGSDLDINLVKEKLAEYMKPRTAPEIKIAELGDNAGVIGALELLKERKV